MFDKAGLLSRLRYKYEDEPLARKLQAVLREELGGDMTAAFLQEARRRGFDTAEIMTH